MVSTIIGAGILGLPYAFSRTGWLLGFLLLLLSAIFAAVGLLLLLLCSLKIAQPVSFRAVASAASSRFAPLIDLAVLLKCFGVATAYLIVVGDVGSAAANYLYYKYSSSSSSSSPWMLSRELAISVGFALAAPLSCLHNLDGLKYTSSLSLLLLFVLVVVVVMYGESGLLDPCEGSVPPAPCAGGRRVIAASVWDIFRVLPIFIFGFTCHQNSFSVVNEIREPTAVRIGGVFIFSVSIGLCLYSAVAASGYHTYGDFVQSDLLRNYPQNGLLAVLRLLVAFIETFHYPLQMNPARRSALSLLELYLDSPQESTRCASTRYAIVTAVLLVASFSIALIVSDLGVVIGLVGATGSLCVSYVIPGAVFLLLFPAEQESSPVPRCVGSTYSSLAIDRSISNSVVQLSTGDTDEGRGTQLLRI